MAGTRRYAEHGLPLALLALAMTALPSPASERAAYPVAAPSAARPGLSVLPRSATRTEAHAREQGLRASRWRDFPDLLAPPGAAMPDARHESASARRAGLDHAAAMPETLRVAFLRIDFQTDRGGTLSTGDGRFDLSTPDTLAPPIDRNPHNRSFYLSHLEAMRRYYAAQSFERYVVVGDVWPRSQNGAYSVSDMADFGPWDGSVSVYDNAVHLFRTMLFAADSQSTLLGDRIPWDQYDRFAVIHAGSDHQSDLLDDSPEDIPTFTVGVTGNDVVIFPDSTHRPIERASILPETQNQDGSYAALNGVIAHESGHNLFGFGDVYDTMTLDPVVGYWSLMDSGHLTGAIVMTPGGDLVFASGLLPPSVDPFQRQFITPTGAAVEAVLGDTLMLIAIERHDDIRRVTLSGDEHLLLENRYLSPFGSFDLEVDPATRVILGPKGPDRFEYDYLLPGGGVLIWHIDESALMFGYMFNGDSTHRAITVLEADGLHDLGDPGSPYRYGAPTDPWFVGNATLLDALSTPPLRTHAGVDPKLGVRVLDIALDSMRVLVERAPQVTVLFPNGGEDLVVGGDVMLVWNASAASGIVSVGLDISRDRGATWETIAFNTPNTGGYVWHVTRPATPEGMALFRVRAADAAGIRGVDWSEAGFTINALPAAVEGAGADFALGAIGPNPTSGAPVRIAYAVGRETDVRLSIHDLQGRVLAVLAEGVAPPGRYEARWDHGAEAPPGLYFVTYRAAGRTYTRRVVVTR